MADNPNNLIFNAFKHLLFNINGDEADRLYMQTLYNVWTCPRHLEFNDERNSKDTTLYDIASSIALFNIGTPGKIYTKKVDSEGLEPETTIQQIKNIPCSAYIFNSNFEFPECYVRDDYSFPKQNGSAGYNIKSMTGLQSSGWDLFHYIAGSKSIKDTPENRKKYNYMNEITDKYFQSVYMFNSAYDRSEYHMYNIPEDLVNEGCTELQSESANFSGKIQNISFGGLLLTRTYHSALNSDHKNFVDYTKNLWSYSGDAGATYLMKNTIPVAYYDLPKTYVARDGQVNIRWNSSGLMSIS